MLPELLAAAPLSDEEKHAAEVEARKKQLRYRAFKD